MNAFERSTKAANALGGKTARACESCMVKRARWFCSADDAFLCQACDVSVHSDNLLASKHERLRLEASSYKVDHDLVVSSSWHQGFTKKARTPRQPKLSSSSRSQLHPSSDPIDPLVPEYNSDDYPFHHYNENEELSVFRVPVFDPGNFEDDEYFRVKLGEEGIGGGGGGGGDQHDDLDIEGLFTACDVDSFSGFNKDLGLGRSVLESEEDAGHECNSEHLVQNKRENEECDDKVHGAPACHFNPTLDMELDWDFDYTADSMTGGDIKTDQTTFLDEATKHSYHDNNKIATDHSGHQSQKYDKRSMLLRLDYEAIIAAWESQYSPWIDGVRPHQFNIDEFLVACIGKFGLLRSGPSDAEREARVSRYREKRRMRLFSKKIRYQVRKLNAENRPRIKGRFVKRTMTTFSDDDEK